MSSTEWSIALIKGNQLFSQGALLFGLSSTLPGLPDSMLRMTAVSQVTKEYHELLRDDRKDLQIGETRWPYTIQTWLDCKGWERLGNSSLNGKIIHKWTVLCQLRSPKAGCSRCWLHHMTLVTTSKTMQNAWPIQSRPQCWCGWTRQSNTMHRKMPSLQRSDAFPKHFPSWWLMPTCTAPLKNFPTMM